MTMNKVILTVSVVAVAAWGFLTWDQVSQAVPKGERAVAAAPSHHIAVVVPKAETTVVLPETQIYGFRPAALRTTPKTPCRATNEGTRDLIQGSGTVRTYTFCN
jgi:hypothetical protein